ncbi:MAG: CsgG/HfaB family protein [Candidatus Omnitrophica bacterium]|nr:CsgG/HfaB family protein [Candidatus Omnitrophota bacterium]
MRKALSVLCFIWLAFIIAGCTTFKPSSQAKSGIHMAALPAYSGPKAKIVVADFDLQAAKAGLEVASGLRQMLLSALNNSNRFSIVDRQKNGTGVNKNSDLIVSVTVTEFEPQSSGGSAGIGSGGGAASGNLGGLLGVSVNKAHLALDIRVIDSATTQVLAATRVQGQAVDSIITATGAGSLGLGGGLTVYANTPMERAIRVCISEAVRFISLGIPEKYYKY